MVARKEESLSFFRLFEFVSSSFQCVARYECVRLTKWHQYIFSVSLKFEACYITGQWGEFREKNAATCLQILFWYFFIVFLHKICVFVIFISFFDKVSNFRNRILTNQKRKLVVSNCQQNCMLLFVPARSTFYKRRSHRMVSSANLVETFFRFTKF